MKNKRVGCVYLIRADNNLYKIGRTSGSAEKRLQGMQGACACTIELLGWVSTEDTFALEDALHRLFASVRHHGEWFALNEGNVCFILGLDRPEAVRALLAARRRAKAQEAADKYWEG